MTLARRQSRIAAWSRVVGGLVLVLGISLFAVAALIY
jgi:hypothetical protein